MLHAFDLRTEFDHLVVVELALAGPGQLLPVGRDVELELRHEVGHDDEDFALADARLEPTLPQFVIAGDAAAK